MPNAVPAANADFWFISDTTAFLEADLLLLNDSDPDGDPLIVQSVGAAFGGVVSFNSGVITFKPAPGTTSTST
jgi:hypothetical protein